MAISTNLNRSAASDLQQERLESLTRRLIDGESRIAAAARRGEDVGSWEDFWLSLLHEYEALHRQVTEERQLRQSNIAA